MLIEFLAEYGMFFAKAATIVVALLLIIGGIASASHRQPSIKEGVLQVKKLNDKLENMEHAIRASVMDSHALKAFEKQQHAEEKKKAKQRKKAAKSKHTEASDDGASGGEQKNVFVIDFDGDIKASAADHLREEITAVLTMATKSDEVVVVLE
ncbi:MAG: protease SohB, partial [Pseudomonadales bacterium]|nr:protease SohB [Pseudomonadales bacterium]